MSARINDLRDATALRITQLSLPIPVTLSTKPVKSIDVDRLGDSEVLVTISGASHSFGRDARFELRMRPRVLVGVHARVPVDADGEPESSRVDVLIELVESLTLQLHAPFPDLEWAAPLLIEVPVLYVKESLLEKGLFQSAALIEFHTEPTS